LQSKSNWKTIPNPHQLIHLSANCEEVWGVNAQNEIYRLSSSGYGDWEKVADGFKDVSVGTNFVWFLDTDDKPHKCELTSFTEYSVFASQGNTGILYPETATLTVKAYPNPFADRLTLQITSHTEEKVNLLLSGIDGKTVFRETVEKTAGITEVELGKQLHAVQPGIYLLTVHTASGKEVIKIIKR
jgi:hypothetical protein